MTQTFDWNGNSLATAVVLRVSLLFYALAGRGVAFKLRLLIDDTRGERHVDTGQ